MALRYRAIVGKRQPKGPSNRRIFGSLVLTSLVVVLVAGAVASADIPDDRVLHGCYDKQSGRLRLVDNKGCRDDERKVTWNVTGPAGPRGEQGPGGLDGAPGPQARRVRSARPGLSESGASRGQTERWVPRGRSAPWVPPAPPVPRVRPVLPVPPVPTGRAVRRVPPAPPVRPGRQGRGDRRASAGSRW